MREIRSILKNCSISSRRALRGYTYYASLPATRAFDYWACKPW